MRVRGVVKWFNAERGYGFLVAEDGGKDILLHKRELRAFGETWVAEGARVLVRVGTTAKGRQAVEVLDIEPPGMKEPAPGAGPLEPARVKWFDRDKGYGFVNIFGRREDVFLHQSILSQCGFGEVMDGSALVVRVAAGPQGPMVCEVRDWNDGCPPQGRRRAAHRPIALPGGSARGRRDELKERAMAAVLEVLSADVRHGPRRRRPAVPGIKAGLRYREIEASFDLGDPAHVDAVFRSFFSAV